MRGIALASVALLIGTLAAGCITPGDALPDRVMDIRMWVEQIEWEVHPGQTTTVWAFCAEGDGVEPVHGEEPCSVPGPTVRVTEGDRVRVTFENSHTIPHTVHFHGWHTMAADMNGNELVGDAMVVDAGETQTIEWIAEPAGSFIYHCHFQTNVHMEMGMYGTFIVEEAHAEPPDVDHVMVLDEWSLGDQGFVGAMPIYDHFTINGKSFPLTQPILADQGDTVRLHMVNAGYKFHAMHLHGYTPDAWEGVAGPDHAVPTDVRTVAPGQTVVMRFEADRPGVWLMHDHVVPHVTAGADGDGWGVYPRGMLTVLAVGDEAQAALQEIAPKLLEAAATDGAGNDGSQSQDPGGQDADAEAVTVDMEGFEFAEETLTVEPGTTVTWVNKDPAYHTVTFTDGSVDSGEIDAGETWSYTFDEPGTYEYYCKPHASQEDDGTWRGMIGKVVVQEA